MVSIGADIGGSHISASLFEHSNRQLILSSHSEKKIDRKGSADEILSGWAAAILDTMKFSVGGIDGVGLAMPGPFNYFSGVSLIHGVDKFESLYNLNVREALAKRLNLDPRKIRFINDASAFTVAETFLGKASEFKKCTGVTLGTGMGSAFTDDGKPVINRDDTPSAGVLFDKLVDGRQADEVFSTRGLIRSHTERTGKAVHSVLQIAQQCAHDQESRETFALFGKQLGTFLAPHLKKFGTECLVLGGNIAKAYEHFQEPLKAQLKNTEIYVSTYGEQAAMIGAARLMEDDYYSGIKEVLKEM